MATITASMSIIPLLSASSFRNRRGSLTYSSKLNRLIIVNEVRNFSISANLSILPFFYLCCYFTSFNVGILEPIEFTGSGESEKDLT
jgi:hypothetical protein